VVSKSTMSALGHKRTFRAIHCDVCFTSEADVRSCEDIRGRGAGQSEAK
jgi:hypothetical protein